MLPLRNPTLLAKVIGTLQLASAGRLSQGVAAGWYEREFEATGVSFRGRGKIFERNLEILLRLWDEDTVTGVEQDQRLRRGGRPRPWRAHQRGPAARLRGLLVRGGGQGGEMEQVEALASDVLPLIGHRATRALP